MIKEITQDRLDDIRNKEFRLYAATYLEIYDGFIENVEQFGLPFQKEQRIKEETKELIEKLKKKGAQVRNEGASIVVNRRSSACSACKKGDKTVTSYISLMCHRNCYYCFNPNQENFTCHLHQKKDWKAELMKIKESGQKLTHIALTGGEPLLHQEDVLAFFEYATNTFPGVHTRLYTSGDLLERDFLKRLKKVGLREIRFSIKLEDKPVQRNKVLRKMSLARNYIEDIVVEMPVIPGSMEAMKKLLDRLNEMNIHSINLLELCFPYHNAKEFRKQGMMLKYPPYKTLYDFWYAGGLPIAESELLSLQLMEYALNQKMELGIHYCSLENKHFGQIYQQNTGVKLNNPTYLMSDKDYYLKTMKIFGADAKKARKRLKENGTHPYLYDEEKCCIQFHPEDMDVLKEESMEAGISVAVIEYKEDGVFLRELKLMYTTTQTFTINEL